MKHILTLILLVFCASFLSAQTNSSTKTSSSALTKKDSLLCKQWKLSGVEEFGVDNPPNAKQKNDALLFELDRSSEITLEGENLKGTWVMDKAKTTITFTANGGNPKRTFRIFSLTEESLRIEYQHPDLIRTKYNYSAK